MTKAEEYRRNAEEAERKAEQARDLEAKLLWRDIAGHWRDLAAMFCKEIDAFHAERSRSERMHQDVSNLSEVSIQRIADSMELLAKLDTALKRK
jgi:muconolactone delta-isomerase